MSGGNGKGRVISDPREMADFLTDSHTRTLLKEALVGDPLAAQRLHETLAADLQANRLTPYQQSVLVNMHAGLAEGRNPEEVTLTAKPENRPPQIRRDKEMFMSVHERLCTPRAGAPLPKGAIRQIYEDVGAEFGVNWVTVKGVYLRERKKLHGED